MTTTVDLEDARWLVSEPTQRLLAELATDPPPLHTLAAQLRKTLSATRSALAIEQLELRERARAKFRRATEMLFTRVGLQQATDEATASYKAARFGNRERIADLCTGVGGDLIALAERADATGVESDAAVALLAEHNLTIAGRTQTRVLPQYADAALAGSFDAWHADPDRRSRGRRTTQLALHSPDEVTLTAMLHAQPNAAIKVAPAAEVPESWAGACEQQWLSRGGECRQLCVWSGALAEQPGHRRATRVDNEGLVMGDFCGQPAATPLVAGSLGEYLYEPDAAVLAAQLTDAFAAAHSAARVARGIGYLTGDAPLAAPLASSFRVLDTLPLKQKTIAAYLRERGVGRLEIKHRGVTLDPHQFRKELKLKGDHSATLIAFPHAGRNVAVIVERITDD